MQLAFAEFVLDTDRRQLLRADAAVPLSAKAFQLLRTLAESAPRALSKQDLMEAVWPNWLVSESTLTNLIWEVRRALGDTARKPTFVRTIHGFGYAFAEATPCAGEQAAVSPGSLVCRLRWGTREVMLPSGESLIGRQPGSAIWLDDYGVSRRHARIVVGAAVATIEDLGSRNGTLLRGAPLTVSQPLADGDEIRIADTTFVVRLHRTAVTTVAAS